MITYGIMLIIVIFLLVCLVYQVRYSTDNINFFDSTNTKAMRGFWCLIVILVHTPSLYQNRIQDMIGSFAYIGVTFFFMTSAYGVQLAFNKAETTIKGFWSRRLPKLIIPNVLVNIIFVILKTFLLEDPITVKSLISINGWVKWLIICNFAMWCCHKAIENKAIRQIVLSISIVGFSMAVYILKYFGYIETTIWSTEVVGFIYGALLANMYNIVKVINVKKWHTKVVLSCIIALVLGVLYLKYKYIFFMGDYLLKILLGFAIISFILILNTRISIGNRINLFLGEISYEVYLVHGSIFYILRKRFPNLESGVYILVCMILTVVCSVFIHTISKRIIKLFTKSLNKIMI